MVNEKEDGMKKAVAGVIVLVALVLGAVAANSGPDDRSKLCVVWSSGDPAVAKNTCFMYVLNAKRFKWFDEVHLVVWGPSAKRLAKDRAMQAQLAAMKKMGVVVEACVLSARMDGVDKKLQQLGVDCKLMGPILSNRLKSDWKVITF
jgi:hypothetical protein